jgi:hypothetical protein
MGVMLFYVTIRKVLVARKVTEHMEAPLDDGKDLRGGY